MDHGHPLHLGVHVHRADTAEAAEALGLDLVVVPDAAAPRGSAPDDTSDDAGAGSGADVDDDTGTRTDLDAWTLLTYVAARTRTVHVSTTGLDLGARLPTVLARAAAGLDHLSDGRLALGLSAMGAPRRRPSDGWPGGQSDGVVADGTMPGGGVASGAAADSTAADSTVASAAVTGGGVAGGAVPDEALAGDAEVAASEEAITVLRGMWDAADPTPLRFVGAHHEVPGAPRGPAPAHAVPLWLSGAGAAGRALAARVADGWWLTAPGVLGGEAATGGAQDAVDLIATLRDERRALDAATTTAGRDPREVRLLVTLDASALRAVGTTAAIDLLTRAVVDAGAGTLVLADTSEDDTGWFASEVAAPLRAAVATERAARGTVVGTVRSAAVRAARQPHIDYDGIPAALRDDAVEPGDPGYAQVRSTYMRGGRPGLVLRPGGTAEVAQALTWARTQDVPLAIRSGGHGISGRSTNDGGIVLDLGRMNAIEVVDVARRRVRVQPGARWGEVAQALRPYGWAITSGDYGGVGVGGLATAGGIGFLVREHGLTIDHVRGVEVVLADGSVVRADEQENADLFWGVRGAGGNLGIVTSFDLEADEVGDVGFAQLVFDASDTADFLHRFGTLTEAAPRDLTPFLILGRPQGGQVVAQLMAVVDSDDPDTIIDRLQPYASLGPLLQQAVQVVPYTAVVSLPDVAHAGEGEPITRSAMVEHLTPALAEALARLVRSGESYFFQIRAAGGTVGDVPQDATAYAHRSAQFSLVAFGSSRRRLDAIWDAMAEHVAGNYSSFETDPRPERLPEVFGERGLARLRELKRRYDPADVFRHNHSVAVRPGRTP